MTAFGAQVADVLGETVRAAIDALATVDDADMADATLCLTASMEYGHNLFFIGVGKSGIVAQKTAASFRSFGAPAFYLHAGDCAHGDMGAITHGDTVVAFTHSGVTDEVVRALQSLDNKLGRNYSLVLVTSSREAVAALEPDAVLPYVANELMGHVPTASCVAQLVYGDALLSSVVEAFELTIDDFGCNHPGGSLGRRLTTA